MEGERERKKWPLNEARHEGQSERGKGGGRVTLGGK